jgi:excisionase family DNA binding protein
MVEVGPDAGARRLISTTEAARRLGIARSSVYRLFESGRLAPVRIGLRRTLVDADDVQILIESAKAPRPAERPASQNEPKTERS